MIKLQIPLKLILDHSPILAGICYGPVSEIRFLGYNNETIQRVVEFLKTGNIEDIDEDENDILKFADNTKMDKLKVVAFNKQQSQILLV